VTGSINVSGSAQIKILPGASLTVYASGSINISGGGIVNQMYLSRLDLTTPFPYAADCKL